MNNHLNSPYRSACGRALLCAVAALAGLTLSHPAFAIPYAEQGDAGDVPASAQITAGPPLTSLTAITGTLTLISGISDGDMFAIFINSPTTFSATTTGFAPGVNNFDTQLFLFNAAGLGVYANDDDPTSGSPQSTRAAFRERESCGRRRELRLARKRQPSLREHHAGHGAEGFHEQQQRRR